MAKTQWTPRNKPTINIAPLKDAYREVCDQNNQVIYIIVSDGKVIPATFWAARKPI